MCEKFERVQKLFPEHSEVGSLIQDCEIKLETESGSWFWVLTAAIAIAVLLGITVFVGAIIVVVIRFNTRRVQFV